MLVNRLARKFEYKNIYVRDQRLVGCFLSQIANQQLS